MTERSIELVLAGLNMKHFSRNSLLGIGANSSYCWTHHLASVPNPRNDNLQVTICKNFDTRVRSALPIFTLEHIDLYDCWLVSAVATWEDTGKKLLQTAGDFLVTIRVGYNLSLDQPNVRLASGWRLRYPLGPKLRSVTNGRLWRCVT
jgi:hypothetical protein